MTAGIGLEKAIVTFIARDPKAGKVVEGTGGVRKNRVAGRGKGKSGGYRLITFYGAEDVPVFLLDVYGKDEKDNLSAAEKRVLKAIVSKVVDAYRASTRAAALKAKGRRR